VRRGLAAPLAALAAAGAARAAYAALKRYPPGGEKAWTRSNHRGEPVTLLEGPAAALGAVATAFIYSERPAGFCQQESKGAPRAGLPLALAGAGALCFGVVDDLAGSGKRRGLRGHLGALAHGEVTTGAVKLAGLGATGLASAVWAPGGRPPEDPPFGGPTRPPIPPAGGLLRAPRASSAVDVVINAGLVAGGANLLNLFDLRPGRAIKVATASGALIAAGGGAAGRSAVAAPLGAALALAPDDLGERAMLGDAGANALGAMLGAAAAVSLPRTARLALLAGIVTLTAASEKVSFTKVIERTPPLRWLDMLGRRPPVPADEAPAGSVPADEAPAGSAPVSQSSQRQEP
jgi:UDP-GlcNAc:undecaprenyl-phosphate GlcNAc-1-phosphate transferase